ncbi:MAG: hypothetical protein Q9168_002058 [Polycauliona sp. 1 TL-2023]
MADPLSFVASVIAVATLAEVVVTKGYRYLRVVKNCQEDVSKMVVEANVLCGVLNRLVILLRGGMHRPVGLTKCQAPADTNRADTGVDSDSESDGEVDVPTMILQTPDFIYECQRTLEQIHSILKKFGHSSSQSLPTTQKKHRFSISALRRLELKDLKWPLSQSKTRGLITSLERHKATCTLALTGDGVVSIHTVLKHTQLSNKTLADIRAKQEKMLNIQLNHSEVHPALKHRAFRQDRHDGTGLWLFDLPEMSTWLQKENPNAALWVYGIPGSGKTTLSTLLVDEFLHHKRSRSVGVAYFYIRHDDKNTHSLSNLLGSLISQLARQKTEALASLMECYADYNTQESPVALPSDKELLQKFRDLSSHFTATYIMIDGLDE